MTLDDYGFSGDSLPAANIRRGEGITKSTFKAVEDLQLDEEGDPSLEAITITVTGPNGNLETVLTSGNASGRGVTTPTNDATVDIGADGSVKIQK